MSQDASELAVNDRDTPDLGTASDNMSSPSRVADLILRELVNAATFGSIKAILRCCHAMSSEQYQLKSIKFKI